MFAISNDLQCEGRDDIVKNLTNVEKPAVLKS